MVSMLEVLGICLNEEGYVQMHNLDQKVAFKRKDAHSQSAKGKREAIQKHNIDSTI